MPELRDHVFSVHLPEHKYTYQRLPDASYIRLLLLAPCSANESNELTGVLFECPMSAATNYRALSYVWGTDQPRQRLWTPTGFIPITTNLSAALYRIRHVHSCTFVWADAVCINQEDLWEKNHQIPLMQQIYRSAIETAAFLGCEEEDSSLAIHLAAKLAGKDFDEEACRPKDFPDLERCGLPSLQDRAWPALRRFLGRPWFRRTWIVQECVVSKHVTLFWGHGWSVPIEHLAAIPLQLYKIDLPIFQVLQSNEEDHESKASRGYTCLFELLVLRSRYHSGEMIELYEALLHCRLCDCTLPQDKYFAMLGICGLSDKVVLQPDYTEPLVKVAIRYSQFLLDSGIGCRLLSLAQSQVRKHDLPSWIPSWQSETAYWNLSNPKGPQEYDYYEAATALPSALHVDSDNGWLIVRAALFDSVKLVGFDHWQKHRTDRYAQTPVLMIWHDAVHFSQYGSQKLDEQKSREQLWQVVTLSQFSRSREPYNPLKPWINTARTALKGALKAARDLFERWPNFASPTAPEAFIAATPAFVELGRILQGWKFTVLANGSLGMVPGAAREGDIVALVAGARVPYLVRPVFGHNTVHYTLLGECYIYGIMQGEVIHSHSLFWADMIIS